MKHITINRAEQADVDAIMQLMQEAVDTVKVSDWFLPDNRQYIEEHISDRGFTLKALSWAFLLSIFRESQNIILDMI